MTRPARPHRRRRATHRLLAVAAALVATASLATALVATAAAATARRAPRQGASGGLLLALGDSLAAGYQPTFERRPPPNDPATGLPDQGYPGGYAAVLAARRHLRLVDVACPGETTASFSGTPPQKACRTFYARAYGASSQLAAALAVIGAHKGAVRLVTIDLGANDVDGCLSRAGLDLACLDRGATVVGRQLRPLLARLKAALRAADPGARLVGMNYYDPFLGLAYDPGDAKGLAAAGLSVAGLGAFNAVLAHAYRASGIPVADVAAAFSTGSLLPLTSFRGKRLTRDAARVCQLTYMCPAPSSRVPQDIHPNRAGYAAIAGAFAAVLRS